MRKPLATMERTADYTFTPSGLRNALTELGIDYREGPKEFAMECVFNANCQGGKKPRSLYVLHSPRDGSAANARYHCFKCHAKGNFYTFVQTFTHWGEFETAAFVRRHRATGFEPLEERAPPRELPADALAQYMYRHPYCYDRKLTEETLRRYKIGYDLKENDIIFPWFNRVGKLVVIKRRAVLNKYYRFEGEGFNLTPLLYGLHLVRQRSVVWLTEGEFDAMYLDQIFREYRLEGHGAVALGGKYLHASALKELLSKAPKMIVLALDSDTDGDAACVTVKAEVEAAGLKSCRLLFEPGCKDPNESSPAHIVLYANELKTLSEMTAAQQIRYAAWKEKNT
jgi:DNA primase